MLRYSDIDEASGRANDKQFGLGGSVWSADVDRRWLWPPGSMPALWVNKHLDLGPDIPYAGAKQSGIGVEMSLEGLEEFTQATVINVAK